MFAKVLVANRGEIALRVVRALRDLEIRSVAVYSEVDRLSQHVRYADEAHPIGPADARESYLNGAKIIEVALAAGVDAIHPGYGFLAENADFAEACEQAGLTFIGPSPDSIRMLGDKIRAREIAVQEGIPVAPASPEVGNIDEALEWAKGFGALLVVLDEIGVEVHAEAARAAFRRLNDDASVARAEVDQVVALPHLRHAQHALDDLHRGLHVRHRAVVPAPGLGLRERGRRDERGEHGQQKAFSHRAKFL